MTQWIITSSLLILAVLVIRAVGRDRLSGGLRYALWGLVLLRLLWPGTVGESPLSLHSRLPDSGEEIISAVTARRAHPSDDGVFVTSQGEYADMMTQIENETTDIIQTSETTQTNETTQTTAPVVQQPVTAPAEPKAEPVDILPVVWIVGMVLVGTVFLVSNLRFWLRLRRSRVLAMTETVPVYESAIVETPCLFGFPRPAVYVTPEVMADALTLRHVLAHELSHYRHLDHIWSMLRCVAVTVHWYNPLVWLGAHLSRQDAELACDEGALHRLDSGERMGYARTLLDLTCPGYRGMFTAATSMTGSAGDLKARVLRIAKNPKMTASACIIAVLLAAVVGVSVFSGEQTDPMEGVWRAESRADYAGPPSFQRATVVQELEFRDGKVRITVTENGGFYAGQDYSSYTMEDGVLQLQFADYDTIDTGAYVLQGDTLKLTDSISSLLEGEYVRYDKPDHAFLPDGIVEVLRFEDLTCEPVREVYPGATGYWEHEFLYLLATGEILAREAMPPEWTWTDYCYRAELRSQEGVQALYLTDGFVCFDGTAYRLSNAEDIAYLLKEAEWQTKGGLRDEFGMTYYEQRQSGVLNVMLWLQNGYQDLRYYVVEDQAALTAAFEEARKHVTTERPASLQDVTLTALDYSAAIVNMDDEIGLINLYSDGTVVYGKFVENTATGGSDYRRYYILPEDAEELMEILKPYLDVFAATAVDADIEGYEGIWRLTGASPDPAVRSVTMQLNPSDTEAIRTNSGTIAAQSGDTVHIKSLDFYVKDGYFHVRWSDGTEESVPCRLEGDAMILTAQGGEWVFERSTWMDETLAEAADITRMPRWNEVVVYADLSDAAMQKLEALLHAGMQTETDNIIAVENYCYKLNGLEAAFGANEITLSDYGTLHFNGEAYALTNWSEVRDYLDEIFQTE